MYIDGNTFIKLLLLLLGQDSENQAAHPHQEFPWELPGNNHATRIEFQFYSLSFG